MIGKRQSLAAAALTVDVFLIAGTFLAAAVWAQSLEWLLLRDHMFFLLILEIAVWYFTSNSFRLYEDLATRAHLTNAGRLLKAVSVQTLAAVFFIFAIKEDLFTRNFIVLYSVLLFAAGIARSVFFRKYAKYRRRNEKFSDAMLIIGSGKTAEHFVEHLQSNPAFNYGTIVMIGDEASSHPLYRGTMDTLEQAIQSRGFDSAVIALERSDTQLLQQTVRLCNKYALHTFIIPDYFRFLSKKFDVAMIGNFPILTLRNEPLEELHWRIVKRAFDIFIAVGVIVFVATWLFPILIILQKLTSPGPVFFLQDRVGKGHRSFRCFKFRSMKHEPEPKEFMPVAENDDRVTAFGRFLRKSNLDELPQIVNVLLGDMSLVGPRPHAVAYDDVYKDFIEELRLRNLVKPGITGWAQIHGLRGDVKDEHLNRERIRKRIEYDVWYIENWSFTLDLRIIFSTAWHMVIGDTKGL